MAARKKRGGLKGCGCPKGARMIRVGKFGTRCFKGKKMVKTVFKRTKRK